MAMKARMQGREALMRRLNDLVPNAEKYAADEKLEVAKEAAVMISAAAPYDTGTYMENIKGERQADNPNHAPFSGAKSKDPHATAVYAPWIWRFLEFGTKSRVAQPSRRNTRWRSITVMTKATNGHPGTTAQPHVFPTWNEFKPRAKKRINAAINRAVREVMGKR